MQPEISISYDSSRGTGYAGLGFAIDGFGSTIERCEKTIADDGEADRIRLDDSDALCFGGRRMALISGVHGEVGAEYRPRRDPFEKIVLLDGDIGEQSSRWEAWLGDGRIIEYSARIGSQSPNTTPLKWYSDSIRDRYGNSLDYHWVVGTASVRPDRITYGDGREIRLEFSDLPAVQVRSGYVAGRRYEKEHILDRVRVYGGGGVHLWDYDLSYDVVPGTQQRALESVQRCDAVGACLPETWFSWNQVAPEGAALGASGPPMIPPQDPFVTATIESEFVDEGFYTPDFGGTADPDTGIFPEGGASPETEAGLLSAWASGAFQVMDLDGDGTDEVLVQDFDTGYFALDPDDHIESMPDESAVPPLVWVDMLDIDGFPDPEDPILEPHPTPASVALPNRSALEAFATDMIKSQNGGGDPTYWSFADREQLHNAVLHLPAPDEDDSLGVLGLGHLLSVSTDSLPPGLAPMSMSLFGGSKDALLFPISPTVFGESGTPTFATWFVAAHEGIFNEELNSVNLSNYSFNPGGQVHSAIPVDHDGNGLTDLWMCRGNDPKHGTWTLALNRGDDPPAWFVPGSGETSAVPNNGGALALETFDSGVRCSSLDETLVVSADSTRRSTLLVSPAFDPDSSSETMLTDAERVDYLRLMFDSDVGVGSFAASSLPRDRFQRWHDRGCRNGPVGTAAPIFGAGPGRDRQVDINGDGLIDILRFELLSGDSTSNLNNITDGLMSTWRHQDSCSESATHRDSVVRVYLNLGDGVFEPQATPLPLTFNRNPHGDFWLTWMNGWLVDINTDGLVDIVLPVDDGDPGTAGAEFEVWLSRPDGSFIEVAPGNAYTWPHYFDDTGLRSELARLGSVAKRPMDRPGTFQLFGDWNPSSQGYDAQFQELVRKGRPLRLGAVTDGLGRWDRFRYDSVPRPDPDSVTAVPAAKLTSAQAVVTRHEWRTGPGEDAAAETFSYRDPRVDLHGGQLLGFSEVTRTRAGIETRKTYDFTYDASVHGYPSASVPSVVRRRIELDGDTVVECEMVPDGEWDVRTPNGGTTWFSYPARQVSFMRSNTSDSCEQMAADAWYDAFKSLDQTRNDFGGVVSSIETVEGVSTTTSRTSPVNDEAEWFIGRFDHEVVTSCAGTNCETRTQAFVHDAPHAELDRMTIEPGDPLLELTTEYFRDDGAGGHGRTINKTVTDFGGNARVERFGWDDDGVHLEWQSNPLGHQSFFVHDGPTGTQVAVVEPNGVSIERRYDGFLRPVRMNKRVTPMGAFSGTWEETEYEAPGAGDSFALRTVVSSKPTGQVMVEEVGPTGKTMRTQWEGVVHLDNADFLDDPGSIAFHNRVEVFYEYDARGRLMRESKPTWVGAAPDAWTEWTYDNLNRKLSSTLLDESKEAMQESEYWSYSYDNLGSQRVMLETYTDQDGKSTSRYYDGADRVIEAYDGEGTPTAFEFGLFGVVNEVRRGGLFSHTALSTTTYEYDRLGRRISETAPESGMSTLSYTPFGEVEVVTQPEGYTGFVYDDLGRMVERVDADGFNSWTYDTLRLGALTSSASSDNISRSYTYDGWGRVSTATTAGPQQDLSLEYEYDAYDRLEKVTYPEPGYSVFHQYDSFGYHRRTLSQRAPCSMSDAAVDWEWITADPASNVEYERLGNGIQTHRDYEVGTYRSTDITSLTANDSVIQHLDYDWTEAGDLNLRTDHGAGQTEDFTYDNAHRLLSWNWGGVTAEAKYDVLGNITDKSGQGAYQYDSATDRLSTVGAHAYSYDDNGNVLSDGERTLTWTAQNMVRSLQRGGQAWSLLYDADGTRVVREEASANTATYTVAPTYELRFDGSEVSEARISVLGGTGRVVAEVFAQHTALEENGLWEHSKKYVHDDHLGSAHLVTDRDGAVESRVMYGPWGTARDGSNWSSTLSESALDELPVGFTGHQPDLDAGIINMRGRMYDPAVGRFMSVDPVIENALEVGTWNAYSYVQNRPLSLVDPTGLAAAEPQFKEQARIEVADEVNDRLAETVIGLSGGAQSILIGIPLTQRFEDRVEAEVRRASEGIQVQVVEIVTKSDGIFVPPSWRYTRRHAVAKLSEDEKQELAELPDGKPSGNLGEIEKSYNFDRGGNGQLVTALIIGYAATIFSLSRLAIAQSRGFGDGRLDDSLDLNVDAARHVLWSYHMTDAFGPDIAKAYGDAHERAVDANSPGDRAMDLHNNAVGRFLSLKNLGTGADPVEAVREAMAEGLIITVRPRFTR